MGEPRLLRVSVLFRRVLGGGRLAALVVLGLMLALRAFEPELVEPVQMRGFDLLNQLFKRVSNDDPVVVVDIDDESLAAFGQWPWPRTILAELVDRLGELGAAVVGFDVFFSEPDRMSPARLATGMPGLDETSRSMLTLLPDTDSIFANSIARGRVVLAAAAQHRAIPANGETPPASVARLGSDPQPWLMSFPGLVRPLPELAKSAAGIGVVTIEPEIDGIVRRVGGAALSQPRARHAAGRHGRDQLRRPHVGSRDRGRAAAQSRRAD